MEIRYKMGKLPCGRGVRLEGVRARWKRKSRAQVKWVHWRRAHVGALVSLVASVVVVPDQKGGIWQYVRTEQIIGPMTDLPYSTGVIRAGRKVDERVILPFHNVPSLSSCPTIREAVQLRSTELNPNVVR
jgi:hypothetical protein